MFSIAASSSGLPALWVHMVISLEPSDEAEALPFPQAPKEPMSAAAATLVARIRVNRLFMVNLSADFLHGGLSRVRRDAAGATAASLFVRSRAVERFGDGGLSPAVGCR
jgi:hypothetical protein